jgi:hypothetical protein
MLTSTVHESALNFVAVTGSAVAVAQTAFRAGHAAAGSCRHGDTSCRGLAKLVVTPDDGSTRRAIDETSLRVPVRAVADTLGMPEQAQRSTAASSWRGSSPRARSPRTARRRACCSCSLTRATVQ